MRKSNPNIVEIAASAIQRFQPHVVQRGNRLLRSLGVILERIDGQSAAFTVPSESRNGAYVVHFQLGAGGKLHSTCECPYGEGCKHRAAALLGLQKYVAGQSPNLTISDEADQWLLNLGSALQDEVEQHPHLTLQTKTKTSRGVSWIRIPSPTISDSDLARLTGKKIFKSAGGLQYRIAGLHVSYDERLILKMDMYGSKGPDVEISTIDKAWEIRCSCGMMSSLNDWCEHGAALLLYFGRYFDDRDRRMFESAKEWISETLAQFGYRIDDAWQNDFRLGIRNGRLALELKNMALRSRAAFDTVFSAAAEPWDRMDSFKARRNKSASTDLKPATLAAVGVDLSYQEFPRFYFHVLVGSINQDNGLFEPREALNAFDPRIDLENLLTPEMRFGLRSVQEVYAHHLSRVVNQTDGRSVAAFQAQWKTSLFDRLRAWWPALAAWPQVMVNVEPAYRAKKYVLVSVNPEVQHPSFRIEEKGNTAVIHASFKRRENCLPVTSSVTGSELELRLLDFDGSELTLMDLDAEPVIRFFDDKTSTVVFRADAALEGVRHFLTAVGGRYEVQLPEKFRLRQDEVAPVPEVYLSEWNEKYLLVRPLCRYGDMFVHRKTPGDQIIIEKDGHLNSIGRDLAAESAFFSLVESSHPDFNWQQSHDCHYLSFKAALHKNWFFDFFRIMTENQVTVLGHDRLKHFRYNRHKPAMSFDMTSGIDWFDLRFSLRYGNEEVPLKEIRQAFRLRQDFVVLSDGSLGLLPREWIEQYGLLFRLGQDQDSGIRIGKTAFSLMDEWHGAIADEKILAEVEEKKKTLREFRGIGETAVPIGMQVELRSYQTAGLNWLGFLHRSRWGGILADDMGLGKTVQAIAFLCHVLEQEPESRHLVVMPTTLLFNWEKEWAKFAPHVAYHTHYGIERDKSGDAVAGASVTLTSYGTLRQDIDVLKAIPWNYVILDEAQAIRNSATQIYAAVRALTCRNRIALSGTPIQNNTMDLFAIMDCVNPGYLGPREYFQKEFAAAIDRRQDKSVSDRLRRLIHPFVLRRTKEQVASDLPSRTEMIVYCEMEDDQRAVYDAVREEYREKVLRKVAAEGIRKSSFLILEGLTKLRQVCDAPSILGGKNKPVQTSSVKLTEILRELEDNLGEHKALVFSNFLGMLGLIRGELEKRSIPFEYLDGKSRKRKESVERFQTDDSVRVFLISMMAGGLGVNLTAADYVYIVDPWWNPAVEQQAIDRTHRIGQDKKVLAYKMICRHTVEEKILELQERKKALGKELIHDEAAFFKTLTKSDVEYLFD